MPDIKVESREHSLPPVATPSSDGTGPATSPEWDASMELALLKAVASCKPVGKHCHYEIDERPLIRPFSLHRCIGMHKHFRIMCVQRKFNETSPSPCSINEIWERLGDYYGMGALDELVTKKNRLLCRINNRKQRHLYLHVDRKKKTRKKRRKKNSSMATTDTANSHYLPALITTRTTTPLEKIHRRLKGRTPADEQGHRADGRYHQR